MRAGNRNGRFAPDSSRRAFGVVRAAGIVLVAAYSVEFASVCAAQGTSVRVTVNSQGEPVPDACQRASISAEGCFTSFVSHAAELTPGDHGSQEMVIPFERLNGAAVQNAAASRYHAW